jgi:ribose 5-phosphate isomerase RpiB
MNLIGVFYVYYLAIMLGHKSDVWRYVKDLKCTLCDESITTKKSSNVWTHLKRKHKDIYDKLKSDDATSDSTQASLKQFVQVSSSINAIHDLALCICTTTIPLSIVLNARFKVIKILN